ncbi:MAG: alpha/beta hydrolase domain-containing protein, partial [Pseudomonadota bacterium]|nr:alpha/beta hydrolase domain-containing protein [Pseudomonadota bacterium]
MNLVKRHLGLACAIAGAAAMLTVGTSTARVTQITIASRTTAFSAQSFGNVGTYELIRGLAKGEINPADRRNALITDINLAPRNARGNVEYTTSFTLLKPVDLTKSNHVLVFEVVNRGNHLLPGFLNVGGDPGDGFLYRFGNSYLWSGWQGDIPIAATSGAQEGIDVPVAKNADGSSVTGPAFARFIAVAGNANTQSLPGLGRTPASLDTSTAKLISFTRENNLGQKTGVVQIAASDWAFADCRTTAFPGTADPTRICLKSGFNPSLGYELVYAAKDPLVLGVGMAAMRDVNSFFRYAAADDAGTANPIAGNTTWSIGYGISQSGRFLKNYLLLGFNEDEQGRILWDGADTNIAGQMGQFNIRFAQPGNIANLYEPGAEGPLWWEDYDDVTRGRGVTSLLMRCRPTNTCPKIFEDYGGPELWYSRGGVGITGTDPAARKDLPLPDNVRRYFYASTTHGGGAGGFSTTTAAQAGLVLPANPNPELETRRALFVDLIDWVTKNIAPPPSAYPKFADNTLVPATSAAMGWPDIPLAPKPDGVVNNLFDYDYGSTFRYNDESGVMATLPPAIKQVIPTYVSRVDSDGNDVAGLRSLLLRLPLGTYTDWNPVAAGPLAGEEGSLAAGFIPFARNKAERTIRLYAATLVAGQEVPPTSSTGTGSFTMTLR